MVGYCLFTLLVYHCCTFLNVFSIPTSCSSSSISKFNCHLLLKWIYLFVTNNAEGKFKYLCQSVLITLDLIYFMFHSIFLAVVKFYSRTTAYLQENAIDPLSPCFFISPTEGTINLDQWEQTDESGGQDQPLSCEEINAAKLKVEHIFTGYGGYTIDVICCFEPIVHLIFEYC